MAQIWSHKRVRAFLDRNRSALRFHRFGLTTPRPLASRRQFKPSGPLGRITEIFLTRIWVIALDWRRGNKLTKHTLFLSLLIPVPLVTSTAPTILAVFALLVTDNLSLYLVHNQSLQCTQSHLDVWIRSEKYCCRMFARNSNCTGLPMKTSLGNTFQWQTLSSSLSTHWKETTMIAWSSSIRGILQKDQSPYLSFIRHWQI